jgi:hypothetical protein
MTPEAAETTLSMFIDSIMTQARQHTTDRRESSTGTLRPVRATT